MVRIVSVRPSTTFGLVEFSIIKQFPWRSKQPSLLTAKKEEDIAKNLKKYSKKNEADDWDVPLQLGKEDREKRKALLEDWDQLVSEWKRLNKSEMGQTLRNGEAGNEKVHEVKEVEIEEVLDVTEDVVVSELQLITIIFPKVLILWPPRNGRSLISILSIPLRLLLVLVKMEPLLGGLCYCFHKAR